MKALDLDMQFNEPLSRYTSFSIGGPADYWVEPGSLEELQYALCWAREGNIPLQVLGNGTNVLISDEGFRGMVIKIGRGFRALDIQGEEVIVGGGFPLPLLAKAAFHHNLRGLEFALSIPGTVGGAVAMNAGAYGENLGRLVEEVKLVTWDGKVEIADKSSLHFQYRHTEITSRGIVVEAKLRLWRGKKLEISRKMASFFRKREKTQPINLPSAGCVFKNPQGYSAGMLIDQTGLKGLKIGRAQISPQHANFIVNLGGANCGNVLALMDIARKEVIKKFNISLEPEIKIVERGEANYEI